MVFSVYGKFIWSELGVCRAGLGRILGMGSGGERSLYAINYSNRLSAFGYDSRKERYDEGMEYVSSPTYFCNDYIWDIYHSKRTHTISSYIR